MKLSKAVKPVSYVKANAAEIIRSFSEEQTSPIVITQNGEAKAVLMGIEEYERMQDRLMMHQLLAPCFRDIEAGRTYSLEEGFEVVKGMIEKRSAK